jgi:small-conductance mechanosensitive channel
VFDAAADRRITLPGIHPETAQPTRRIVTVLMWLFAVTLAYPYLPGSGSAAFKGVSVFAGVLFTLGSAGLVGQAMSGLVLMYSRSFKVGDYVEAGGIQGEVVELGLLSTRLRTPKNEYVSLPNNVVVGRAVTNYSAAAAHRRPLVLYSSVTIGYDVPWRRVHELLIGAARSAADVLPEPAPYVLQRALDDSYVEYQVNAAVDPARAAEQPQLYSALHAAIQDAFAAAGVEILSPSYHAVRDGNAATVPSDGPRGDRPRAFRVEAERPSGG